MAKQQLRAEKLHPPIFQLLWVEQCIALYLLCNPLYTAEQWTLHFVLLHFCLQCNSDSVQFRIAASQCKISPMQTFIAKHRSVRFFGPVLRFVMLFNTRDGIQAAHSTRNFNANILHQNQHNPSRLSKWFSGCKMLKPNNFQRAFLTIIWRRAMVKYY